MKYILILSIFLLFNCSSEEENNNSLNIEISQNSNKETMTNDSSSKEVIQPINDIFSNKRKVFKKLSFDSSTTKKTNYYKVKISNVLFTPLPNCIKLSKKETDEIINNTGYGKAYFNTDSLFIEEKTHITALVGHITQDEKSLDNFIEDIMKMKNGNNMSEEYYILNGKKNIQFKILLNDLLLLYVVFEAKDNRYLVLQYSAPLIYMEDGIERMTDSLNSLEFLK